MQVIKICLPLSALTKHETGLLFYRFIGLISDSYNKGENFMSEKHPECPLYNPLNCKEYYNPKICAFVRKDKTCLKKKKPKTKEKEKEKEKE
jgi:hypothetical protein